jgi:ABC-2 type transport system permease protein
MNLNIVSAITRKDLVDAIRHRYLLTALVTPLAVALLFRVLLPGVGGRNLMTLVVHDAGTSELVAELRKTPQLTVVDAVSADAIATEVERRKATGGLGVPVNFDADLAAGKQPQLNVFINNQKSVFEQTGLRRMLNQMVRSFAKQPEPAQLIWTDVAKGTDGERRGATLEQMLLPLLLILTLGMIGAFVVPLLIVEEKEKRTFDFLLASPASLKEIIVGKALTGVVYSLLIAALLLGINRQVIKNWPLTLLTVLLGLLFVVGVGLVLGSLLKDTMQVNTWASIVLMILLAPSFPSLGITGWFETAMRLVPTYYLTEALRLSMGGNATSQLWTYWVVLLGCTLVVFSGAAWALRRS